MASSGSLIAYLMETATVSAMHHLPSSPTHSHALKVDMVDGMCPSISINHIRMASAFDPWKEAQLVLPKLLESTKVHMYGMGLGHLPSLLLKNSNTLQVLNIHVLNADVFKIQLEHMPHQDWLSDPRVQVRLAHAHDKPTLADTLHICLPDLQLIAPELWRLRDRLHALLNQNFINRAFRIDDPMLQERLKSNEGLLQQDPGVKALFNQHSSRHACVIGSGPSLELSMDLLRQHTSGGSAPSVIAVDTAFAPLLKAGIKVDCVVSIEKKIHQKWLPTAQSEGVKLIYTPMVPNDVLTAWKGQRYASFTQTALLQSSAYFDPASCLFCGGSVIHTATDLALKMGFQDISFWGADFGYPGGKTHSYWPSGELGGNPGRSGHWVMDVHGRQLASSTNFANYLSELEDLIARHPDILFLNASQHGADISGTHSFMEYSI